MDQRPRGVQGLESRRNISSVAWNCTRSQGKETEKESSHSEKGTRNSSSDAIGRPLQAQKMALCHWDSTFCKSRVSLYGSLRGAIRRARVRLARLFGRSGTNPFAIPHQHCDPMQDVLLQTRQLRNNSSKWSLAGVAKPWVWSISCQSACTRCFQDAQQGNGNYASRLGV